MPVEVPVTRASRTSPEELMAAHASCHAMAPSLVLDADGFGDAAENAHRICPVSNALRGNVEIGVNTTLED